MRLLANRFALGACAAALLLAAAAVPATAQSRPVSYAEFDVSIARGDGAALGAAITGGVSKYIYLQSGVYALDNPVVIDRTNSLFIHGIDRVTTILVAKNPQQPLFVLRNAPLLNIAGIRLFPNWHAQATLHSKALSAINTLPTVVEILDSRVEQAMLEFAGPGSYRIQGSVAAPGGKVQAAVMVDHPSADVLVFGGDIGNGPNPLLVDQSFHLWQKRGRLRTYATTFEAALGLADVRIERSSVLGPHVLGALRSEGTNGILNGTAISRLLYVPPTTDPVDVVIKNSTGAWATGPVSPEQPQDAINCRLASYNGAGRLWLLGNRAEGPCGRHLVEGSAPQATIISVGNVISSPEPFPVVAARVITAADAFNNLRWTGEPTFPYIRWLPDGADPPKLAAYADVPRLPQDVLPAHLQRPLMNTSLPGMINVKSPPYNARGNGAEDDTAELQAALDAQCLLSESPRVYFPPGTYRISDTLYLNHHSGGTCHGKTPAGGWIAGAGSSVTIIEMAPGVEKGVFRTDGFANATVQGIGFKTWRWQAGDPKEPNVEIDTYRPGFTASQLNNFYDTVFDGGYVAWGTGLRPPTSGQCSSQSLFGSVLKNANFGFVSGQYNAISNVVYDSRFVDNNTSMAQLTLDEVNLPPGGTFMAYRTSSRGSDADFWIRNSSAGAHWHFYEWDSDAPAPFSTPFGVSGNAFPLMFEGSTLMPRAGGPAYLFDSSAGQGFFFLYSILTRSGIRVGQGPAAQGYAVSVGSVIPDWASSVAAVPNGRLEEISWSEPPALGTPGTPYLVVE